MSTWKATTGALALGLMLAASTSPGLARSRYMAAQDWRNARAEAIPNSDMTVGGSRSFALHDCNSKTASLKNYTWGDDKTQRYRSCMARHGQPE